MYMVPLKDPKHNNKAGMQLVYAFFFFGNLGICNKSK